LADLDLQERTRQSNLILDNDAAPSKRDSHIDWPGALKQCHFYR